MEDDPPSSPIALSILREGGMRLDLALLEINRLHLHEETIPELLDALAKAIEEDGVLKDPVIVDRESLVVLDGMHRVNALKRLRCRLLPVCLVDYESPEIRVERWCRTVGDDERVVALMRCIEVREFELREMQTDKAKELLGAGGALGLLETREDSYAITSNRRMSTLSSFRAIKVVEEDLRLRGFSIGYETERDAEEKLRGGEVDAVILPPKIKKREVVETAVMGELFIHKATRHVVPARPVGVDIPLPLLRAENYSVEEARKDFSKTLERRRFRRISPGILWRGRRYEEELYVFE